jgi:hypothetical protein
VDAVHQLQQRVEALRLLPHAGGRLEVGARDRAAVAVLEDDAPGVAEFLL